MPARRSASPLLELTEGTENPQKRIREDEDEDNNLQEQDGVATKKRRKNRKRVEDEPGIDGDLGLNHNIRRMDKALLSDYLAQRTRKFCSKLSAIELEDLRVPGMAIEQFLKMRKF
jgi:protein CMS1